MGLAYTNAEPELSTFAHVGFEAVNNLQSTHEIAGMAPPQGATTTQNGFEKLPHQAMNVMSEVFALETMFSQEIAALRRKVDALAIGKGPPLQPSPNPQDCPGASNALVHSIAQSAQLAEGAATKPTSIKMPHAIRAMPLATFDKLSNKPQKIEQMDGFPVSFLRKIFGGQEWSPGLLYPASHPSLKNEMYYLFDKSVNPFLPSEPGEHGASLTIFMRDLDNPVENAYQNVPLFIAKAPVKPNEEKQVYYYGHYSQSRWSDKLDFDSVQEVVPQKIKQYWADKLASPRRPEWITEALMEHYCPKPAYIGIVPDKDDDLAAIRQDLEDYMLTDLVPWRAEAIAMVAKLTSADILRSFDSADCDYPPGLRFSWEYLKCNDFDLNFYYSLVSAKKSGN